ncbi:hypothetical protein ACHAWU_007765 [Discostella pseudostelligera]|uniref:Uncharacterized protein n=1 Tax=Discostella pseudostelligera TaxID=259834 RepID=A0ABD3MGJ1_9STRA
MQQHYYDSCFFAKWASSSSFCLSERIRHRPSATLGFATSSYSSSIPNGNGSRYRNRSMPHTPSSLLLSISPTTITTTSRLFGCNPNSPNAKPGDIFLSDDRNDDDDQSSSTRNYASTSIPIDLTALHTTIDTVRDIIGYPTYDISLTLINDAYMTQLNSNSRGIPSSTDILSFSLRDSFVEPGVLREEQFDREEYYDLGELFVSVDYVKRRCDEDRKLHEEAAKRKAEESEKAILEGEVVSETVKKDDDDDDDDDTDEYEYGYTEVEVDDEYYEDEYDDRGVAPAMQYIYDPEIRIHMLVVHGMLHLVGYDHETDDEYELMVEREDEVLSELKWRLGEDFGLGQRRLAPPSDDK